MCCSFSFHFKCMCCMLYICSLTVNHNKYPFDTTCSEHNNSCLKLWAAGTSLLGSSWYIIAVILLVHHCWDPAGTSLLGSCWYIIAVILLVHHCCDPAGTSLLGSCWYIIAGILLVHHCWDPAGTSLLGSCWYIIAVIQLVHHLF